MALARAKKVKIVEKLNEVAGNVSAVVFADFFGTKTKDMNELRRSVKSIGGNMQIVKKTLAEKGLKDVIPNEVIWRPGGVAAIWFRGENIIPAFRTAWQFSVKNETFKILGGYVRGIGSFGADKAITIAKLPPKEILLAQFAYALASPIRSIVTVLNGNIQKLVFTLAAIKSSTK